MRRSEVDDIRKGCVGEVFWRFWRIWSRKSFTTSLKSARHVLEMSPDLEVNLSTFRPKQNINHLSSIILESNQRQPTVAWLSIEATGIIQHARNFMLLMRDHWDTLTYLPTYHPNTANYNINRTFKLNRNHSEFHATKIR